jgi:hypothetical protein
MAPKNTAAIATYGDHEVIVPENKLRKAISNTPFLPGEDDPVARAEQALAGLSSEFSTWMDEAASATPTRKRCFMPRMISKAKPRPSAIRPSPLPPTACAG